MPKRNAFAIKPKWKITPAVDDVLVPKNVREAAEGLHLGLKFVTVGRIGEGETSLWRIDFPKPNREKRPGVSAERLAQIVVAMCLSDAAKRNKRATYWAVFHGCPAEEDPRPRRRCQFQCEPPPDVEEDEEDSDSDVDDSDEEVAEDEEGDEDEDDEEEEEEDDEDEDDETEEGREVEDATIAWPDSQPAGMTPAPMGAPARPPYPTHGLTAVHPSLRGDPRYAQGMGAMVGPADPYAREPNDPGALFLRHLGGVFAETRATMREMREDVRESRAETRAANARVLNLAGMSTAHYENMHKASQFGWNALNQGMSMQLNALQNSITWERRIMQTEQAQQPSGFMQALPMLLPLLLGLGGQIIHAIRGGEGPPPQLMDPGAMQAMMAGMGGPPPGPMPPGAPPPPPPPGFGPPQAAPPPPGFDAPPPGFGAPGAAPGAPTPGAQFGAVPNPQGGPPPGFDSPPPQPAAAPPVVETPAPPAGPFPSAMPTAAPSPPPGFPASQVPPAMAPMSPPQAGASDPLGGMDGPAVPMSAIPNGPFSAPVPSDNPGPFAPMVSSPAPPPPAPAPATIDTTARPSRQELDARFTRAPIGTMCHTLLLTAGAAGAQQLGSVVGQDVVELLQQCGQANTDESAAEPMHALHGRLSQAGMLQAAMGQMPTVEQRELLNDIFQAITQRVVQHSVSGATPPGATAPSAPNLEDPVVLPPPPSSSPPKPRSRPKKRTKKKKRGF